MCGAKNETAKQLRELLCLDNNEYLSDAERLIKLINQSANDNATKLSTANKAYVMRDFALNEDFLKRVQKHFETSVELLDFSDGVKAAATINKWVAERTNDKIKDLISSGALNRLTCLVLVNAIYFKGAWEKKFDKQNTIKHDFHGPSQIVKCDMMRLSGAKFNLMLNPLGLNCAVCELPYKGKKVSMRIVLPNENEKLSELEKKLNANVLSTLFTSAVLMERKVNIHLPRFRFSKQIEVKEKNRNHIWIYTIFSNV